MQNNHINIKDHAEIISLFHTMDGDTQSIWARLSTFRAVSRDVYSDRGVINYVTNYRIYLTSKFNFQVKKTYILKRSEEKIEKYA